MPLEKWDGCSFAVNPDELEGRVCYGDLDLSSTTDITAFVLVFPPNDEDDKYYIMPFFWIPEDTMELRVRRDHVPYDVWHKLGFLETTEGNVVHYGSSKSSSRTLVPDTTSVKLPLTAGEPYRWCKTLRAGVLP